MNSSATTTASSLENESVATSTSSMTATLSTTSIETFTTDAATTTAGSWAPTETTWDMDTTTFYDAIRETLSTTESVYLVTEATTDTITTTTSIPGITGGLFSSVASNSELVTDLATATEYPTSSPSSTCTPSCSQESSGLSVTQIGGIVGGIAIFLILCGLYIFCKKERKDKSQDSRASQYVYHQDMKEATFSQQEDRAVTIDVPDTAYNHQNYVPTSLYPRRDSPQTSFATTTVIDHHSQGKTSIELDTDDYTHSAMDIFNGQQGLYLPSLNESILLDLRQDSPRRESTLDPHLLLDKKRSLWDDQI